ncbi:MAG TPA: sensor domain-containing diguanylate cyclase, partial [Thermoanaerobaculia bacterium]|nr:sensor domain-containing diguanylate cyclase [Thermoanaerobaculia bacterium]
LRLMAVRDQSVSEYGDDVLETAARSEAAPLSIPPRVSRGARRELVLNPQLDVQVFLPLQTPAVIAGLLVLESDDPEIASPRTLQELSVLADHVAISLQDRNLRRQMQTVNDRLQSRAETLQRVLELSNELKAHLALSHVLEGVVRAVRQSLGFSSASLYLYDRNANAFERKAAGTDAARPNNPPARVAREENARGFAERYRISKSYFVSHLDSDRGPESSGRIDRRFRTPGAGSWHRGDRLYVPLTAGDQLVGVLLAEDATSGQVPSLTDVQALEIFANHAVSAIQSARAYETTQELSVRDALTEAFNHRYFQEALSKELTRHERTGHPLTLGMLDIDDFKKINDLFGHPVGDVVLKGLVDEMTRSVREMDTLARYGGEEFALIFPETTSEQALLVADRLRRRVASRLFSVAGLPHPLGITVSIGLASYPDDGPTKRALVERADQALYQAKRSGKNCLVTAASLADLRSF